MSLRDQYAGRVQGALLGAVFSLYIGFFVPVFRNLSAATEASNEMSISLYIFVLKVSPDIFTIAGLVGTIIIAGPIFGLIGWGLETLGANALFALSTSGDPGAAVLSILLGAGFVTIGSVVWKWRYAIRFLEHLLSNDRRRPRRRPPRR